MKTLLTTRRHAFVLAGFLAFLLFANTGFSQTPGGKTPPPETAAPAATSPATEPVSAPMSSAQAQPSAPAMPHDDYLIQPGDILQIDVWKEKDLQRELMVRPDGGINFPLIGDMAAAGKSVEQLRNDLKAMLTKYVPDPVVTVAVKQGLGNKIYVIGKVNKPGEYVATRNMDVMQALSLAGGLNPFASENNIKILRRVNGEQKTFRFKYSRVEKGKDLEQNIILQGGDVVVVP